jgi:hypothetical protein
VGRRVNSVVALVWLAACGVEDTVTAAPDTEVAPDTDAAAHTDAPTDSDPTPDTESAALDSGEPAWNTCSSAEPAGTCLGTARCVDGHCLVDLDPGAPVAGDPVATWDALWSWLDTRYPLFAVQPVDWAAVREPTRAALAAATTAFEVSRLLQEALTAITDGHVLTRDPAICDVDHGYGDRRSNVGACLTEIDGELVVYLADPGSGWEPGDRLLRIDGRAAPELLADRMAQTTCVRAASTEAAARAGAVASLLFRPNLGGERAAWVERRGAVARIPLQSLVPRPCPGRVAPPGERDVGGGVRRADLDGGVVLLDLRELGAGTAEGFSDTPMIDAVLAQVDSLDSGTPLIIDLRGNRGGYTSVMLALANRWLPDHTLLWSCAVRASDVPAMPPILPVYSVAVGPTDTRPVAILLDALTYGSAERVPWAMHTSGRALLVGSPSEGAFGTVYRIPIDGVVAYVNADFCVDGAGLPLEGRGVPVDLPVTLQRADLEVGLDTVIEAARVAVLGP